jgi:phospholipid/cholesterol/gamma-HCH transport system substrate-binding protein
MPAAMRGETKEIAVGVLALAALLLVLAFFYAGRRHVAGAAAPTGYALSATFNRIDGLFPGDPVRLGGIRVGTVEKAELDRNYRARLTFRMEAGVKLPEDTAAAIHTDGLFGSKFVVLLAGGEDAVLKPGGAITHTQDALIVSELLELIIAEGRAARAKQDAAAKGAAKEGSRP